MLGLPVTIVKASFWRTWTGINSALTSPRFNTWSGPLRAVYFVPPSPLPVLHLSARKTRKVLPLSGELHMPASLICQGHVPLDVQAAQVWVPSGSHTRQGASGLSPHEAVGVHTELIAATGLRAATNLARDLEGS